MREQDIQRKILKALKARGIYAVNVKQAGRNGVPDILACHEGKFVGIEVKTPVGRVAPLQELNIQWIEEAGGIAFVARSVEDVKKRLGLPVV